MKLLKKGYPEEDEFVFCTVTAIQYHCVFCKLDEYENKSGMIHISEIAAGRVRNTREYVKEGQKVVCKILRVNLDLGHIDLSLRRVNEAQRRAKINDMKQEQAALKIIEFVAKALKKVPKTLFEQINKLVGKKYDSMYDCFEELVAGKITLEQIGIDANVATKLTEIVRQRVKPPEVHILGDLIVTSYASDGVELVKNCLAEAKEILIKYKGAGVFSVDVKSDDYKKAEKILKKDLDAIQKYAKKKKMIAEFNRRE
jgi:translation initiation factor 2 subunit 1